MSNKTNIEECVDKYINGDKADLKEQQEPISVISMIRSKLATLKESSHIIILGGLMSILGGALVVKNDGLKHSIIIMARTLVTKL